jgi:hypothetical protein
MAKYVKGKDGKFAGSVGAGKDKVPTVARKPREVAKILKDTVQVANPTYNAQLEADRLFEALSPVRSLNGLLRRRTLRKELEALFGKIDWSDRSVDNDTITSYGASGARTNA